MAEGHLSAGWMPLCTVASGNVDADGNDDTKDEGTHERVGRLLRMITAWLTIRGRRDDVQGVLSDVGSRTMHLC